MTVNNRPLDSEPLVKPAAGLLGETVLIGTDAFINYLETLDGSVNTQIIILAQTTESTSQLVASLGKLNASTPRQIDEAFSRVITAPGLPARIGRDIAAIQATVGQQFAQSTAAIGLLRTQLRTLNERIAQVEALCLSNLVR